MNRLSIKKKTSIVILLVSFFFLFPQFILSEQEGKYLDLSKVGFLLDNHFITTEEFMDKDSLGVIKFMGDYPYLRDVLLYLGESYRNLNVVYVYESIDTEKEHSGNN